MWLRTALSDLFLKTFSQFDLEIKISNSKKKKKKLHSKIHGTESSFTVFIASTETCINTIGLRVISVGL